MTLPMEPGQVLFWAQVIASVSVVLASLEWLAAAPLMGPRGVLQWEVLRSRYTFLYEGPAARLVHPVLRYPAALAVPGVRAVAAGALLALPGLEGAGAAALAGVVAVTSVLMFVRSPYSMDGADQMTVLTFATLSLVHASGHPWVREAGLWFIAIQGALSYSIAGWAKASARDWRNGRYLAQIMATRIYGAPALARFLGDHPRLAALAAWSVILWESTFILVFFLPEPAVAAYLLLGLFFHVHTALAMGLNTFFWSFVAAYPPIYYAASRSHAWLGGLLGS